jgi:hypothetical protein
MPSPAPIRSPCVGQAAISGHSARRTGYGLDEATRFTSIFGKPPSASPLICSMFHYIGGSGACAGRLNFAAREKCEWSLAWPEK